MTVKPTREELEERIKKLEAEAPSKTNDILQAIFEGADDAMFAKDLEGRYIRINSTAAHMVGRRVEEIIGKDDRALFSPESAERIMQDDMKVMDTGESLVFEEVLTANGVTRIFLATKSPYRDKDGKIIGLIGISRDITVRKQSQEKLRRSEEKYRLLFESSQDCICHISPDGKFLNMNPAGCTINGFHNVEEVIGKSCSASIVENREAAEDAVRRAAAGEAVSLQYKSVTKDGREIWWDSKVVPVKGEHGVITSVLRISRDITDNKRMEEELIRSQRIESIGILAGGIAHDFNNLLTIIGGRISLAKLSSNPDLRNEALTSAETACKRAADITKRLLTFSKGGAPVKKTVSIAGVIRESADFALRGSNAKAIHSIPEEVWPVDIDEGQMSQVFNNLIINAQQAMPDGGVIGIRVENSVIGETGSSHLLPPGEYVKITVQDRGAGIPAEHMSKIFSPYFTTKPKGTGLGLATSYSIVKNHNGYIFVESSPGTGTSFLIYLPVSQQETQEKEAAEKHHLSGIGHILLMDDEEMLRDSSADILRSLGYKVATANDGSEAVEMYRKAKEDGDLFDVVILDLTVPGGMGGKEAVKRLLEIDPKVNAVVSSGYSDDPIMSDFKKYGFKGVLAKPYEVEKMCEVMEGLIGSGPS